MKRTYKPQLFYKPHIAFLNLLDDKRLYLPIFLLRTTETVEVVAMPGYKERPLLVYPQRVVFA